MKKAFVCSPYRNSNDEQFLKNIELAKSYCRQLVKNHNIPYAPHLYFTNILDDDIETERNLGINLGIKWLEECDEVHVLGNYISDGMSCEIIEAKRMNKKIVYVKEPLK